jgi:hypothetical protein
MAGECSAACDSPPAAERDHTQRRGLHESAIPRATDEHRKATAFGHLGLHDIADSICEVLDVFIEASVHGGKRSGSPCLLEAA